jgi:hypothetical protein
MTRFSRNVGANDPGNGRSLTWVRSAAAMASRLTHHAFHFIDEPEAYMRNVGHQFHGMAWLHVGVAHCLLLDIAQHFAKLFRSIVVIVSCLQAWAGVPQARLREGLGA